MIDAKKLALHFRKIDAYAQYDDRIKGKNKM